MALSLSRLCAEGRDPRWGISADSIQVMVTHGREPFFAAEVVQVIRPREGGYSRESIKRNEKTDNRVSALPPSLSAFARRVGFAPPRAEPADAHPRTSSSEAKETLSHARHTAAVPEARRKRGMVSAPGAFFGGFFCIERILPVYP